MYRRFREMSLKEEQNQIKLCCRKVLSIELNIHRENLVYSSWYHQLSLYLFMYFTIFCCSICFSNLKKKIKVVLTMMSVSKKYSNHCFCASLNRIIFIDCALRLTKKSNIWYVKTLLQCYFYCHKWFSHWMIWEIQETWPLNTFEQFFNSGNGDNLCHSASCQKQFLMFLYFPFFIF